MLVSARPRVRPSRGAAVAVTGLLALAGTTAGAPPARAAAGEPVLRAGEELQVGGRLVSSDGRVAMETAGGGLAVRRDGVVIWRNNLLDRNAAMLRMQSDGNLVLYTARGTPLWSSGTNGRGPADLVVQGDGNLVIYARGGRPIWNSGIGRDTSRLGPGTLRPGQSLYSQDGLTRLVMQGDGNLVLYRYHQAMWNSGTRVPGSRLVVNEHAAHVMTPNHRIVWMSPARNGAGLVLQNDGNLVLYAGPPIWSSATAQPNCSAVTGPISPGQTRAGANGAVLAGCYVNNWNRMVAAARAQGVTLNARSSYRSVDSQVQLRIRNCGGNTEYNIWRRPPGECNPPTAIPGRSNHEWGLAVDVELTGAGGNSSPQYRWLAANGPRYGFFNYRPEPWHWSIDAQ